METNVRFTNGKTLAKKDGVMLSDQAYVIQDGYGPDSYRNAHFRYDRFDIVNARVQDLVEGGLRVLPTRMTLSGALPDKRYNLHVDMPGTDLKSLNRTIEDVIFAGIGVRLDRKTIDSEVLVLRSTPASAGHLDIAPNGTESYCRVLTAGDMVFNCRSGSFDRLARIVEGVLGKRVVNETGLDGSISVTIPVAGQDERSIGDALQNSLGLTLTPAKRPIEIVFVSAAR